MENFRHAYLTGYTLPMRIDSVLILFLLALITLAGVHQLALSFYLYWVYPWFDIPMHFLGGAIIALGSQTPLFEKVAHLKVRNVASVIVIVLAIGLLWEVFEWKFVIVDREGYALDTFYDIIFDSAGGLIGFWIASSFRKHLPF